MRSSKINYFAVGLFVIIVLTGLVVSLAVLTGRTGATDSYHAYYNNVSGIKFGSQVVYEGYPIGQVEKVTPEEINGRMMFRADFTIFKDWKLPNDSFVEIAAPNLLAAVVLNIHAGIAPDPIEPGSEVPSKEMTSVFSTVGSLADQLAVVIETDVKPLLGNIDDAIKGVNGFIGDDASGLINDLSGRIPAIANNIEEFSETINTTSQSILTTSQEVGKLVRPKNRLLVEEIIQNMNESTVRLNDSLVSMKNVLDDVNALVEAPKEDMEAILSETRYVIETVSRHIDSINQNMDSTARNMSEFSRQIRANPGMLLNGTPQTDQAITQ